MHWKKSLFGSALFNLTNLTDPRCPMKLLRKLGQVPPALLFAFVGFLIFFFSISPGTIRGILGFLIVFTGLLILLAMSGDDPPPLGEPEKKDYR